MEDANTHPEIEEKIADGGRVTVSLFIMIGKSWQSISIVLL